MPVSDSAPPKPSRTRTNVPSAAGAKPARSGGASEKLAGQIRHQAASLRDMGTNKAIQFADAGKNQLSSKLDEVAEVIQTLAGSTEDEYGRAVGQYLQRAADAVSTAAENLRGRSVEDLVSETGSVIRNNPGIAIGTAALFGFAAARIAKGGLDEERDAPASATEDRSSVGAEA